MKEKEVALKDATPKDLEISIQEIQSRYLERKDRWWSSDKAKTVVEGFMNFGDIFMTVFNQVLSSAPPEYGAAFAVVNFIYKVHIRSSFLSSLTTIRESKRRATEKRGYRRILRKCLPSWPEMASIAKLSIRPK
jgi:hypothetical protein